MLLLPHSLLLFVFLFFLSPPSSHSLSQDGLILQQAKLTLSDPSNTLSGWTTSSTTPTPCSWTGVSCDPATDRVVSLNLSNANLFGPFPTILCRLPHLSYLSLSNNSINSTLPPLLATCRNLTHLILSENLLVGTLPTFLHTLPVLSYLDLSGNNFSGHIPPEFALFPNLHVLSLTSNLLTGTVPGFLGDVATLTQLNLSYNPFDQGEIPPQIGKLVNLEVLWMAGCNLIGEIPGDLFGLKKIIDFDLSMNSLTGRIPAEITNLEDVVQIELFQNGFSGELPLGWSKLKKLRRFDASLNQLEGLIPDELCRLPLESLNLFNNRFVGGLPESIASSPNLNELRLFDNQLKGVIPKDLGKNSPLKWVELSFNEFSGEIPAGLCEKGALEELILLNNSFSGGIPVGLGQCRSLTRLRLSDNRLSGDVPAGIWGLPFVYFLDLVGNSFTGRVSESISGATNLSGLLISKNRFEGRIPDEIGLVGKLVEFSASDNLLEGPIPGTLVKLIQLGRLDLHNNKLSGEFPIGIEAWKKLNELNLATNELSGEISPQLGSLPALNYLDLSGNQFTGKIPLELQNLKLNKFNLSDNRLSGDLPPLYDKEIYRDSFLNNPGLCGDLPDLCPRKDRSKNSGSVWLLRSIFVLAGVVFIVGVVWFYWKYLKYKKAKEGTEKLKWTLTSFHKLGFSEYEILDCLDEDNVIGTGGSGKVYKAVLSNGDAVAVKKLWVGGLKKDECNDIEKGGSSDGGFEAEVETLGKIRHKNIVKLWCCCTTRDSKLLVYEYMPNGSLGDLLHSSKGGLLDWPMRHKIAIDAAEGLSYLHHDCVPPIVHRDVKSNNILLDGEFGARVADFGVAKVVDVVGKGPKSMSVIAGSCGYIAPEYAYTLRVNEKSDIYSFGVVILELVTGKRPIDPEYGEKDLVKWVCTTLDQKGPDHVIDPKLDSCYKEDICRVLNIGLLCTSPLPINRPSMRKVVKLLQEVIAENNSKSGKKDGKLSPYYHDDVSDHGSVA
ncbi:hypothetical protein Scep_028200 [Stephania cephalantha]|uniref:non-specific serine/threonine protein kinase n=1 Tax=Stephania cephalantha TaxID=152367 RepID=A0AAP0ED83_9MAGN